MLSPPPPISQVGASPGTESEPDPADTDEVSDAVEIAASHVLVQYAGARRAPPIVARTKEEARKRAEEALAKLRDGADFAEIVREYSDEPGAALRGGSLGRFTRDRMVEQFADAAFALKPGQLSDIVETPFGFHVIKRTE